MHTYKGLGFGLLLSTIAITSVFAQPINNHKPPFYKEPYRPQIHFSPKEKWMNDPNGMVYYKGTYHLFYQYDPNRTTPRAVHWGHATSTDLVHWVQQPIALYPDRLGLIFSGSAVVDKHNTSGFGKNGQVPLVAIYTNHDTVAEQAGRIDHEVQSLAYSIDDGKTWIKYKGNPVLKNPGSKDFRDPKVFWYEPGKKWVMSLATYSEIFFYSSPDLKSWTKESSFGKDIGAHGGVWECPDLFELNSNGKKAWVLIVNLNPGGPNGGSATQYFVGDFDGKTFKASHTDTRWIDYGPDEYAGITWSNTGDRQIFLGWMSNWLYGKEVPTDRWRSAMTVPRDLGLMQVGKGWFVTSLPAKELNSIADKPVVLQNLNVQDSLDLASKLPSVTFPCRIDINLDTNATHAVVLSNAAGEELIIGFDAAQNQYYMDRTRSGKVDFQKDFAGKSVAPRISGLPQMSLSLVIDVSSVELFADNGLSVMTGIFFPSKRYTKVQLKAPDGIQLKTLTYTRLASIWK